MNRYTPEARVSEVDIPHEVCMALMQEDDKMHAATDVVRFVTGNRTARASEMEVTHDSDTEELYGYIEYEYIV